MDGGPLPGTSTAFRPARHGFAFANADLVGRTVRLGGLPVAPVRAGLCGGMCVWARELWRRGEAPPTTPECPDALLWSLQRAQLRSFRLPWAPARYLRLQQPGAGPARTAATLGHAVPDLGRGLANGEPVLLGLVCALGRSAALLSRHHVVLATAARPGGHQAGHEAEVEVTVYDPNHPGRDDVHLQIRSDGTVRHSQGRPVHAVFGLDRR